MYSVLLNSDLGSKKNLDDFTTLGCRLGQKSHFLAFGRPCSLAQFQLIAGEHGRAKQTRYGIGIGSENTS